MLKNDHPSPLSPQDKLTKDQCVANRLNLKLDFNENENMRSLLEKQDSLSILELTQQLRQIEIALQEGRWSNLIFLADYCLSREALYEFKQCYPGYKNVYLDLKKIFMLERIIFTLRYLSPLCLYQENTVDKPRATPDVKRSNMEIERYIVLFENELDICIKRSRALNFIKMDQDNYDDRMENASKARNDPALRKEVKEIGDNALNTKNNLSKYTRMRDLDFVITEMILWKKDEISVELFANTEQLDAYLSSLNNCLGDYWCAFADYTQAYIFFKLASELGNKRGKFLSEISYRPEVYSVEFKAKDEKGKADQLIKLTQRLGDTYKDEKDKDLRLGQFLHFQAISLGSAYLAEQAIRYYESQSYIDDTSSQVKMYCHTAAKIACLQLAKNANPHQSIAAEVQQFKQLADKGNGDSQLYMAEYCLEQAESQPEDDKKKACLIEAKEYMTKAENQWMMDSNNLKEKIDKQLQAIELKLKRQQEKERNKKNKIIAIQKALAATPPPTNNRTGNAKKVEEKTTNKTKSKKNKDANREKRIEEEKKRKQEATRLKREAKKKEAKKRKEEEREAVRNQQEQEQEELSIRSLPTPPSETTTTVAEVEPAIILPSMPSRENFVLPEIVSKTSPRFMAFMEQVQIEELESLGTTGSFIQQPQSEMESEFLIEKMAPNSMPPGVIALMQALEALGYRAYIMGGYPRDVMLAHLNGVAYHHKPDKGDIDIVTNAPVKVIEDVFSHINRPINKSNTHRHDFFHTIIDKIRVEITISNALNADTLEAAIAQDTEKRDYRINTLYMTKEGKVYSCFGRDILPALQARQLKTVKEDPEMCYQGDPARCMRHARFIAEGYYCEYKAETIRQYVEKYFVIPNDDNGDFKNQINTHLWRGLNSAYSVDYFKNLLIFGVLQKIFPDINFKNEKIYHWLVSQFGELARSGDHLSPSYHLIYGPFFVLRYVVSFQLFLQDGTIPYTEIQRLLKIWLEQNVPNPSVRNFIYNNMASHLSEIQGMIFDCWRHSTRLLAPVTNVSAHPATMFAQRPTMPQMNDGNNSVGPSAGRPRSTNMNPR